ncbi:MAG: hypothetical protein KC933_39970, partial [Myxococcales bacterium]|nr:hypothetical protein [Myxococcales bacterium]
MLLTRVSVALALVTAGLLALDCADGGVIDPQGGGGTTSSTGQGGTGGLGGAGVGGDGQGGDSLCEQDCSTVDPPDCYISVCNEGAYPGPVGECVVVPVTDGATCDDGLFCTIDDTCQAGICTGGGLNDCGMTPPTCQAITCDEISGTCATEPADEGMACTSDDLCQVGTTCSNGVCGGGTLNDCLFAPVPNMCHVAVCNPMNGMCEPEPGNEGQGCTDPMDPCTVN